MGSEMDSTDAPAPWRPYEDDPLFTPQLLQGPEAMPDENRLLGYLDALVARRGTVHTTVAFNAVYFGYDLDFGGYAGGPVDFDAFPHLSTQETADPLPVGAMVSIETGNDPLYAEIVHRESRIDPRPAQDIDSGYAERLVFDVDAFSPGTVVSDARFDRLRAHRRWIDPLGHLHHRVRGTAHAHRRIGEHERFVRYLLGPGRSQLMAGPLPLLLRDEAGPPQMAAALRAALNTIDRALSLLPSLGRRNGYAFHRRGLAHRMERDGPLGGPDLDWLVRSVVRPAPDRAGRPRERVTEVGAFLRALSGSEHELTGTGYLDAIVHANTLVDDHVNEHGDGGALPNGMRIHLADPHHEGGRWIASPHADRSDTPATTEPEERRPEPLTPWEYLVEYEVAPFLRRLPRGQRAGVGARVEYHRLLSRFGIRGDLPDGFTLVRGHSRTRGGATGRDRRPLVTEEKRSTP